MDDLPIIELPDHYRIDGKKLRMAHARVPPQANSITEHQAKLQQQQSLHEEEQQRFFEQRVAATREEADARCQALVLLRRPIDTRASHERTHPRCLQHGAQEQARALAEVQLADQAALCKFMERRVYATLQRVEQKVSLRTNRYIQDTREDWYMYKYVEDIFQVAVRGDNALALGKPDVQTITTPSNGQKHGL
ncbi:hypothetical protein DVH05_022531 [Phytophthora capsici]|nr:hypothetical protein DVH05_022531 [Phytophthora capsici]|eukprot:jgi/Phyca11/103350/e_gw1.8.885.1